MTVGLRAFADRHRLRVQRSEEDGTLLINGRHGHIYEVGDEHMAVILLNITPRMWAHRRRVGSAAGMTVIQDGDFEGTMTFDPINGEQVDLAIRLVVAHRKRRISEETRERLHRMSRAHRFGSPRHVAGTGFPRARGARPGSDG